MEDVYLLANGFGRLVLRALGVRVYAAGATHVPCQGPVILAANHVSFPDFVLVQKAVLSRGRYIRFMTRADIWHGRWLSFAMDRMGHIPVARGTAPGAYLRARRLLGSGEAVGVFPEAGISHSYTIRSLMRGVAALARDTGAPVIPVAVWGGQRIASVGDPNPAPDLTRGRRVDVAFGSPWYVGPDADLIAATHELGHRMTALLESLQRLPEHRPRPGEIATWYPAHLGGHAPTRERAQTLDVVPTSAVPPTWGPS